MYTYLYICEVCTYQYVLQGKKIEHKEKSSSQVKVNF